MTTFSSNFAQPLEDFIREKRAVGHVYETSQGNLQAFDRFCCEYYTAETQLTRTIAMHWGQRRPDEHVNTLIRRITPIRQFAKYLNRIGVQAYVIPRAAGAKGVRYIPHIFTKEELTAFFAALDQCKYNVHSPVRHLVLPVIFRVLYCCGLRSSEVIGLRVENLDLTTGKITILQSKGHKDRVVMLSEDVLHLCQNYDQKVRCALPQRTHFFPNPQGSRYTQGFLGLAFHEFWDKAGILHVSGNRPRVHDFRHAFAVHRLNQWVKEGKDLNAYLPYLSMYLGHEHLTETDYYLHLVPEFFPVVTDKLEERFAHLLPEVNP